MTIKALFWDIGGVLLTNGWDREQRADVAQRFGLDTDDFTERHRLAAPELELGRMTLAEYLEQVVFYQPRDFTPEDFRAVMEEQSQPRHEAQARSFRPAARIVEELEPEQQRLVARLVEERRESESDDLAPWEERAAPELRITANVVRKLGPDATVYHPESGAEVELGTLSPPQRYEVIREHVNQKAQAYHEKQAAKAQEPPRERVNWADWFIAYAAEHLDGEQQLELVIEQGPGGEPRAVARVMSKATGEILARGEPSDDLKKAVLTLRVAVSG